ncbi:MAG: diguanylate cyclase domain-containing protein, partial [Nitrospirales bacterium]
LRMSPPMSMKKSLPSFIATATNTFSGVLRVLIADSVEVEQKRLCKIFEHHDVTVLTSQSGVEALSYIQEQSFDFICASFPLDQTTEKRFFCSLETSEYNHRTPLFIFSSLGLQDSGSHGHDGLVQVFSKQDLNVFFQYITSLISLIQKNCFFRGRLLYVEGNTAAAKSMKASFQRMGLNVNQLVSAQKAYESFENEEYDLVVVALGEKSPSKEFDLIIAIRSSEGPKSQRPILAVCASKKLELVPEALKKGANDYVGKIVAEEELQCRVRNLLLIKNLLDKVDAQEKELRQLVMTDELTDLYSKPFLFNAGNQRSNEAYRHGYPFSLVLFSLDHFERINEQYGQSIGDMVLQEMGKMLKTFSRNEDIVARTNDDEFALALPHCSEDDAKAKVDRLREFVESANPSGIPVTASLGVVSLPSTFPCDFEDLFSAADRAMTQARSDGRNRTVVGELVPSESGLLKVILNQLIPA